MKVYILPFIAVVKVLKSDNPKQCPFDILWIEKCEMEKSAFKVWDL